MEHDDDDSDTYMRKTKRKEKKRKTVKMIYRTYVADGTLTNGKGKQKSWTVISIIPGNF